MSVEGMKQMFDGQGSKLPPNLTKKIRRFKMKKDLKKLKCYEEMKAILAEVELNEDVVTLEDFAKDLYETEVEVL